ncbi:AAA family ATPase, partial [Candidatus Woesearchaeota archaeon]|nr:AAA family ATPase [Candidatus Woesearchaeota archaeon]
MKFPYGIADFGKIRQNGYFYQDRTHLIPQLETAGEQLLFLRPRRFGKSLLLSMLEHYYDINQADSFANLFGDLAIGQNPTLLHNRYFILHWDFSLVKTQGDVRDIEAALHRCLNQAIDVCAYNYKLAVSITQEDAIHSLGNLLKAVRASGHKIYLFIDEYDNFANEILMARKDQYEALLYGEGLFKTVFKAVKAAAGQGLDRVFITGVSPVALSDITSGYNVATNIYLEPEFNALCGFTEAEISRILQSLAQEDCRWVLEDVLATLRT